MPALDLAEEPIPLWWTTDFILASPVGTPAEEEKLGGKPSSSRLPCVCLGAVGSCGL